MVFGRGAGSLTIGQESYAVECVSDYFALTNYIERQRRCPLADIGLPALHCSGVRGTNKQAERMAKCSIAKAT